MSLPDELLNTQQYYNQCRQQRYYQKLLAYYGGTFPIEYTRRVNKGLNALRQLRAYWREKEGLHRHLDLALLTTLII